MFHGDQVVGIGELPWTVPNLFSTAGISCGYAAFDTVDPSAYEAPFTFTGTIEQLVVDLSGELTAASRGGDDPPHDPAVGPAVPSGRDQAKQVARNCSKASASGTTWSWPASSRLTCRAGQKNPPADVKKWGEPTT